MTAYWAVMPAGPGPMTLVFKYACERCYVTIYAPRELAICRRCSICWDETMRASEK